MDALERVRRVPRDRLARRDVAGQGDEPDVGMRDEALADGDTVTGDDAQDACRKDVGRELPANRSSDSGVCSDGFKTCVFPAARAGASFQTAIISG